MQLGGIIATIAHVAETREEPKVFHRLQQNLLANFTDRMMNSSLFYVPIDRTEIWERYISGFDPEQRQEHNCNACKSFLRQYGGIVAISRQCQKMRARGRSTN